MLLRVRLFVLRVRIRSLYRRNARAIMRAALLEVKADYLKERYEILSGEKYK